jgi:hypothetical protein
MILDIDKPVTITVTLHTSGALSVAGPVSDRRFCISMLQHAIDSVRAHHLPKKDIVVPPKDVALIR